MILAKEHNGTVVIGVQDGDSSVMFILTENGMTVSVNNGPDMNHFQISPQDSQSLIGMLVEG